MFGWLRRRLEKEHAKLLIQNLAACEVLRDGWYIGHPDTVRELNLLWLVICDAKSQFELGKGLPSVIVDEQLLLNRQLRKLHEAGPFLAGDRFDKAYQPLLGWDWAITNFLEAKSSNI